MEGITKSGYFSPMHFCECQHHQHATMSVIVYDGVPSFVNLDVFVVQTRASHVPDRLLTCSVFLSFSCCVLSVNTIRLFTMSYVVTKKI